MKYLGVTISDCQYMWVWSPPEKSDQSLLTTKQLFCVSISAVSSSFDICSLTLPISNQIAAKKDCFLSYSLPPSTDSSVSLPSDRGYYFSFSKLADALSCFTHCQDTDLLVYLDHNASYCYPHGNGLLQTFPHSILHALQDLLMLK